MTDSVLIQQSGPRRAAPKKRREGSVSSGTDHKPARAARSTRRTARLRGAARDSVTLDLFPEDTTLATLEAMNIDIRQGTLFGFELPDVVLAAVGALDSSGSASGAASASVKAKARRASRLANASHAMPMGGLLSGLEIEDVTALSAI